MSFSSVLLSCVRCHSHQMSHLIWEYLFFFLDIDICPWCPEWKGASLPYCCARHIKSVIQTGRWEPPLWAERHISRRSVVLLCLVEGRMLVNGDRRESLRGSPWPVRADSALGAGSGAAVQLALPGKTLTPAHCRGRHPRRHRGAGVPCSCCYSTLLCALFIYFLAVLICITCLRKV